MTKGSRPEGATCSPAFRCLLDRSFRLRWNWTAIDPKRGLTGVLSLRVATTRIDHELRYIVEELHDPPDNEPWFSHRRTKCSKLLRDTSDLSLKLRHIAKLPTASDDIAG